MKLVTFVARVSQGLLTHASKTHLVRAGVTLVFAVCLAIAALLGPAIVGISHMDVAQADSIIDPESQGTGNSGSHSSSDNPIKGPKTETYGSDGNETGKINPNSRARILDDAVAALKNNPPIYVDPRAQLKLTQEQQDQLAIQISATGDPIFVAILPSQAGRPSVVTETIAKEVGKPGVYATIVGVVYSAYASEFEAKHVLTQAFLQERHNGPAAVMSRFAELSSETIQGHGAQAQPFPIYFAFIVGAMALALPVVLLLSARRNKDSGSVKP